MIKEFVNYNEALALKELGFDEPCIYVYIDKDSVRQNCGFMNYPKEIYSDVVKTPFYQQTFRFFREKYEIHSYIERLISGAFIYKIDWFEEDRHNKIVWECKSYSFEEAELECIKKLIEIAQKRI